jgi:uncharacterized membrane protein (UPF0136 family)
MIETYLRFMTHPRRKISFGLLVLIGIIVGIMIKRVQIGLLIGLALGLLAGSLGSKKD